MTDKDITQRPNYFAGQYLLEDDYEQEQNYHIDRQQRHNRLLHVSGIAEGLSVTQVQEGGLKIKVSPGTAVDKQGKQIILHTERPVDLPGNGENTLFIKYAEKKDSLQEDTTDGYRRIAEEPAINFAASESSIALAKLTVTDGKITIDESVRQYSGLRLPGAKNSEVTLRSHGNENPNLANLTGSLSISGTLAVKESIRVGESEKGVTLRSHGDDKPDLAVLTGSLSISGALEVKGGSTLTGNVKANGSLTVTNSGTGHIAEFTQQGSGSGVYIGGVKGNHTALYIAGNETDYATFAVDNKGSGYVATFTQQGSGGGVYIHGVKGKNNALNIAGNETSLPTFAVANKGSGTALFVDQQGTGLAAKFKGNMEVVGEIRSPALRSIYQRADEWSKTTNSQDWKTVIEYSFTSELNPPMQAYVTVIANGHGISNDHKYLDVAIFINQESSDLPLDDSLDFYYGMGITHYNDFVPITATRNKLVTLDKTLKIEVKIRARLRSGVTQEVKNQQNVRDEKVTLNGAAMLILLTGTPYK